MLIFPKAHLVVSHFVKKPKYGKGENPPAPPKAKARAKANMASYHLSVKVGAKGKALPHANYIAREGDYKTRQGEKLEATEHGNMPEWAKENPSLFWQCADQYERKMAVPIEKLR